MRGRVYLGGNVLNSGSINWATGGESAGDLIQIMLRSTVQGTPRTFSGSGVVVFGNMDIQDTDYAGLNPVAPMTVYGCVDSGGNSGLIFASGHTKVWTSGGNTYAWSDPNNWTPTGVPGPLDVVAFNSAYNGYHGCEVDVPATVAGVRIGNFQINYVGAYGLWTTGPFWCTGDFIMEGGYFATAKDPVSGSGDVFISGNLVVDVGSIFMVQRVSATANPPYGKGATVNVGGTVTINGTLCADNGGVGWTTGTYNPAGAAWGFDGSMGPFVGPGTGLAPNVTFAYNWQTTNMGKGGSYGGAGGCASSIGTVDMPCAPYGTLYTPTALGSGGAEVYPGFAGKGGGALKLLCPNSVTVNGVLSANGMAGPQYATSNGTVWPYWNTQPGTRCGGGSGGSLWVVCNTLTGTGTISAQGGVAYGGCNGGGGRIDLSSISNYTFTGNLSVQGGPWTTAYTPSYQKARAGTIALPSYLLAPSATFKVASNLWLGNSSGPYTFGNLWITNGANLYLDGNQLNESATNYGGGTLVIAGNLTIDNGSQLSANGLGYGCNDFVNPNAWVASTAYTSLGSNPNASTAGPTYRQSRPWLYVALA